FRTEIRLAQAPTPPLTLDKRTESWNPAAILPGQFDLRLSGRIDGSCRITCQATLSHLNDTRSLQFVQTYDLSSHVRTGTFSPTFEALPEWIGIDRIEIDFQMSVKIDYSGAVREQLFQQAIEYQTPQVQNILCIDIGSSSVAASLIEKNGVITGLKLGAQLAEIDSQHDEAPSEEIIASNVGIGLECFWPFKHNPLGFAVTNIIDGPDESLLLDELGRHRLTSVPFAPAQQIHKFVDNVIFDPKRRLVNPTDEHGSYAELTKDMLAELAHHYLLPALHKKGVLNDGLDVVLTHPNRFSSVQKRIYANAAGSLLATLGIAEQPIKLVPESDAAAVSSLGRPQVLRPQDKYALAFDFGGGTLDLSFMSLDVDANGAFIRSSVTRRLGAAVGGGVLDILLHLLVHWHLNQMQDLGFGEYTQKIVEPDPRANTATRKETIVGFQRDLATAKADLEVRCRKSCQASTDASYAWSFGEPLKIRIGVQQSLGLFEPTEFGVGKLSISPGVELVAEHAAATDASGPRELNYYLQLDRFVVDAGPIRSFVDFATRELTAMCCDDKPFVISVTGRASLFPLIYESLDHFARNRSGCRLLDREPMSGEAMKTAVVAGAAQLMFQAHAEADHGLNLAMLFRDSYGSTSTSRLIHERDWHSVAVGPDAQFQIAAVPSNADVEMCNALWGQYMILPLTPRRRLGEVVSQEALLAGEISLRRHNDAQGNASMVVIGERSIRLDGAAPSEIDSLHPSGFLTGKITASEAFQRLAALPFAPDV
ncbi:MAG: hypothetical protein O7E57_05500, partial [Gammaproteobacteria bacterium]|nr:hypothetical protein [Gammaproteobacteria bacterium]